MSSHDFDLLVIGAGSGGVRASRIAAGHGARVAVAEEYRVGGTCVIRGCVPKKLLVYGSHFAEDLEDARRFGWQIEGKRFDWAVLRDNVAAEVDRLNGLYQNTLDNNKVTTLLGHARIIDAHTVEVEGQRHTADTILIASGARPFTPDIPGAEHGITSNEVFHLAELPKRMVIAGAGYIATEFAGVFHELGVDVTLINRSETILRGWEPALADRLLQISMAKGLNFKLNCRLEQVEKTEAGLVLHFADGKTMETDVLMWALGRVPNIDGLGLDAVGIALNHSNGAGPAIAVDSDNRTNVPNIFAVGDVTDRVQLTPVAIREGHSFADREFGTRVWHVDYRAIPSAVFSNPPLGSVGLTEAQARNEFGEVRVFTSDFRPMKNVLAGRNERALYKLIVDASSDRVVGAHMIGPDAPEILQAVAIAVKARLTKAQFDDTMALHPTMSEELVLMR